MQSDKDSEGLLIERGFHFCNVNPNYNKCFKILYNLADIRLFYNKNLQYNIANEIESFKSISAFIEEIGNMNIKDIISNPIQSPTILAEINLEAEEAKMDL